MAKKKTSYLFDLAPRKKIILETIKKMPKGQVSNHFLVWLEYLFAKKKKVAYQIFKRLEENGYSTEDAIRLLSSAVGGQINNSSGQATIRSISGGSIDIAGLTREWKERTGGPKTSLAFNFGTRAHDFFLRLLTRGEVDDKNPDDRRQLSLCPQPEQIAMDFGEEEFVQYCRERKFSRSTPPRELLETIRHYWRKSLALGFSPKIWTRKSEQFSRVSYQLEYLLSFIFGDRMDGLDVSTPEGKYLYGIALRSWAAFLAQWSGEVSCGFFEINVLPPGEQSFLSHAGRMDLLEITSWGKGQKPTMEEMEDIRHRIIRAGRAPNLESVIGAILDRHGQFQAVVKDLKFCVGDVAGSNPSLSVVKDAPAEKDRWQMLSYLTFAHLIYIWCRHEATEDPWSFQPIFTGELIYFFPAGVKIWPVAPTTEELRDFFRKEIVERLSRGRKRANLARATKAVGMATQLAFHNGGHRRRRKANGNLSTDIGRQTDLWSLEPRPTLSDWLAQVADSSRVWAEHKPWTEIRSVVSGGKEEKRLVLHWDKFVQASLDKSVPSISRPGRRGPFITCPNPSHQDRHPSCYLHLDTGSFKCFSCGVSGRVEGRGAGEVGQSIFRQAVSVVVDEKHATIMKTAQKYLSRCLWRSESVAGCVAQDYLRSRRIPLDLAYHYGVGFDDGGLVFYLLKKGFPATDLIHYGFLGLSAKKDRGSPFARELMKVLSKLGQKTENFWPEDSRPYPILRGRMTVPLSINGQTTANFYGRDIATRSKDFAHRKLSNRATNVAAGVFNISAFFRQSFDELILTEGIFDALSLIAIGHDNVMAATGLDERSQLWLPELLARSGKRAIHIALDTDKPGREAAQKSAQRLRDLGFKGEITDFTHSFFTERGFWDNGAESPLSNCPKDFNAWLKDHEGHREITHWRDEA
ncbi:toprim domain-containing protein [Candidatus Microgenomates bacterium]|nr:toprim domain-containing protein [Candidatus Microgenomates bacterium]